MKHSKEYWLKEAFATIERLKEKHQKAVKGSQYDLYEMKVDLVALEAQMTLVSMGD